MSQQQSRRLPPHNLEAEQSLLGALLIDKDAMVKIADVVNPEDFYKTAHGYIFDVMVQLFVSHEPIDVLSVANLLDEKKRLDSIGKKSYLLTLANAVPTSAHVLHYANIVQKKATLRRMIHAAGAITDLAFEETEDVSSLLDQAESQLFAVSQQHLKEQFTPIKHILNEAFDRIDELHKSGDQLRGLPTGFNSLDKLLGGLQKSDLIILAARPAMGKTTFALDISRQAAITSKKPVAVFSLEMSKEQLVDRLISSESGVDLWKMRTGKLSEGSDDFPKIGQAMGILAEAPIFIDDKAGANIMDIRTKARRLQMEHGLGMIVIDYLQLMEGRSKENRVQEISEISRGLKGIARELNVPVLALSQLSRGVEQRQPPIPKPSDLRESGSIEQDADIIMFIYRDEVYNKDTPRKGIADIIIAKHRNGPCGQIELFFDAQRVSFKNMEKYHTEEEAPAHQGFHIPNFESPSNT